MIQAFREKMQRRLHPPVCRGDRSDGVHCVGLKSSLMTHRSLMASVALAVAALTAAMPAHAQRQPFDSPFQRGDGFPSNQWDTPRRESAPEQREKSLSEILRMLKGQYSGRHLDARKQGSHYIISWITEDGRRLTLRVNAVTGRVE